MAAERGVSITINSFYRVLVILSALIRLSVDPPSLCNEKDIAERSPVSPLCIRAARWGSISP